MTTTVLQNARIIDPSRDLDETGTIIVRNGKILAAGKDALNQGVPEAAIVRDCRNLVAVPGLIDARVFTGEPMPVAKAPGDSVVGATLNGSGALVMQATRVGEATVLARIVQLVAQAQRSRAPMQKLADRVSYWFVLGVIGEYLGRLYVQSKNRPLFIIEEVVRAGHSDAGREPVHERTTAGT